MNILSTNQQKQVVSLEELVPQHDCLKLLILHTPYTLLIDTLPLCTNLVKLDLSKNNLETFPYLGELTSLRFMFLHENNLDLFHLKGIFEHNNQKSKLSQNIVWVTFWGNKNHFLARHYLANETKAISVDKHMIVPQERSPNFQFSGSPEAFSEETDISDLLKKKNTVNRHASEEEYMNELWEELRELRKKHVSLFPIIKIQKVFRGWHLRESYKRANVSMKQNQEAKLFFFSGWKEYAQKRAKLKRIMQGSDKQYLLAEGKQARHRQIAQKMLQWARRAREIVSLKKVNLIHQIRIAKIFRHNQQELKTLYQFLQIQLSKSIYISRNDWSLFENWIVPFVSRFSSQKIIPQDNVHYSMHCLYNFSSDNLRQFIKILQTNIKSVVFYFKHCSSQVKMQRRGKKSLTFDIGLKNIYRPQHFSNSKMKLVEEKVQYINNKNKYSLEELVKVEGTTNLLKNIVRAIYFFNTRGLKGSHQSLGRIQFFSEATLRRISSAIKIQKVWRGFNFRKKNQHYLKLILKMQRAATIIQRWFRRLPTIKRKEFMFLTAKKLNSIHDSCFYINSKDYFDLLTGKGNKENQSSNTFLEQHTRVFLDRKAKLLSLGWYPEGRQIEVLQNMRVGKIPFSKQFFLKEVELNEDQIKAKVVCDSSSQQIAHISHIFHFLTETSILKRNQKQFIQIRCSSRSEARFRCLLLKLMTYSLKQKEGINLLSSQQIDRIDEIIKIQPKQNGISFICNQNISLLQLCPRRMQSNTNLHIINVRFYFSSQDKKPLKTEQKFYVYVITSPPKEVRKRNQQFIDKRYKTEAPEAEEISKHIFTDLRHVQVEAEQINLQQQRLKKVINKRSMKQFKIDKRLKQRKQQPSFILDSVSINDRLTTQPENLKTQPSICSPHSFERPLEHEGPPLSKSNQKAESAGIIRSLSQQKKSLRLNCAQRKAQLLKRKQDDSFVRRFVNLGNFIQNQFAIDYRRKIKTQSEHSAIESAEYIKRSMERSHSQRVAKIQEKFKEVREKHSQHRQMIAKNENSVKEQTEKLKAQVSEERDKRQKQKSKLKRLKVSFAQECYPLGGKGKSSDIFL